MHISVQRDVHIGMPQNFTQALYIEAMFYANGGKGVPEHMEIYIFNTALSEDSPEMILHAARLYITRNAAGQNIRVSACISI